MANWSRLDDFFDNFPTFSRWSQECSWEVFHQSKGTPARFWGCFDRLFFDFFRSAQEGPPIIFQHSWMVLEHFWKTWSGSLMILPLAASR